MNLKLIKNFKRKIIWILSAKLCYVQCDCHLTKVDSQSNHRLHMCSIVFFDCVMVVSLWWCHGCVTMIVSWLRLFRQSWCQRWWCLSCEDLQCHATNCKRCALLQFYSKFYSKSCHGRNQGVKVSAGLGPTLGRPNDAFIEVQYRPRPLGPGSQTNLCLQQF